jgi:long-chain acyl-CoA synthetase
MFEALLDTSRKRRFAVAAAPLIIYTSGTTSLPRGIVPRQQKPEDLLVLAEYFKSVAESRQQHAGDVVMVTLPMHHGAGPSQFQRGLHLGNTLVLMRRFEPESALALIQKWRVNVWSAVPTLFKRIAGLPEEVIAKYDLSSVRVLGVGAAPVPQDLKIWVTNTFGRILHEGYGSTETGMVASLPPSLQDAKPGSCGRPHRHVAVSIRDTDGRLKKAGEIGEIWVRTPVTIHQYLHEARLGPDSLDAEGYIRTGDAGYLDDEGYLFITDRVKDMIISGGANIYPAEIEAVIARHPAIQDVAVIGIPDDEFGEKVKAFCEARPGHTATPEEIAAYCAVHLASYKRPKSIEVVTELPRNPGGKLLKRVLREPYWLGRSRRV